MDLLYNCTQPVLIKSTACSFLRLREMCFKDPKIQKKKETDKSAYI